MEAEATVVQGHAGESALAAWRSRPWRGIWLLAVCIAFTVGYMKLAVPRLGIPDANATLFYPTAFFLWGFSFINIFQFWPFHRLKQPWCGLASVVLGWAVIVPLWAWLSSVMDPYAANAMIFYMLFFVFTLAWFSDDVTSVIRAPQPIKGITLVGCSMLLGWIVYTQIGVLPQMWLFFIPMWFFYFFELWPVPGDAPRVLRIAFWVAAVLGGTLLLNYIHNLVGAPMSGAVGSDIESIIWAGMTPFYVTEVVSLSGRQPWKGVKWILSICATAVVIGLLYYYVFHAPDWWMSRWIFVLWAWIVAFQWMTWPWPAKEATETEANG